MIPPNLKKFSKPLAVSVAFGVALASFISICFELGNGSLLAGISSARSYLLIYGFSFIVLAGIAAVIALLMGRFIGTTITAATALCLLLAMIVTSYIGSKPISRFRRLVWEAAPGSLQIYQHQMQKSFGDGTTYIFVFASDPDNIGELCRAAKLSKVSDGFRSEGVLPIYFPDVTFPSDIDFHRGGNIELAYTPSGKKAFVVVSPKRVR